MQEIIKFRKDVLINGWREDWESVRSYPKTFEFIAIISL